MTPAIKLTKVVDLLSDGSLAYNVVMEQEDRWIVLCTIDESKAEATIKKLTEIIGEQTAYVVA